MQRRRKRKLICFDNVSVQLQHTDIKEVCNLRNEGLQRSKFYQSELSCSHIQQRFVPRLAIVSALISLGVLAVITITLSMRTVSSNELYEKGAQKLALGLKGSDIRLLQVSIAAQYFFCDQK